MTTTETTERETHTLEEAKARFKLITGAGDGKTTACAMTALSWIHGDSWSDSMPCAHMLIRSLVTRANDDAATTEEQRWAITEAGAKGGVIDTWWIPTEVIVWCVAQAPRDASLVDQLLDTLDRVTRWKETKEKPNLADANLAGANLADANLAGADLARADLAGANLADANLADANLADADLARAYLARADLAGANLADANLADAYLADANLADANLADANLAGANLADANLADANLADANLADANLARAYGTPLGGMPSGWELNDAGLYVRKADA